MDRPQQGETVDHDLPLITVEATLREAMETIDRFATAMCLFVGPDGVLLGTLSDGDVRRALLSGSTLVDRAFDWARKQPRTVGVGVDRSTVIDLMRSLSFSQIPEVDAEGRLVRLHLLREVIGGPNLSNRAVILSGGRGTRLRSVTGDLPKPMVRVAGRPILERLVLHLVGSGITDVALAVGYRAEVIERHFGDGSDFGCRITYLYDDEPRGTAGPLRGLIDAGLLDLEKTDEPLIVLNGDLVTSFSVGGLLGAHCASGATITIAITDYAHEVPYGVLEMDDGGSRVIGLQEKPTWVGAVNAGVYAVDPRLVADIPDGRVVPMTELIERCIDRGDTVTAWPAVGEWHDVGQPEDLARARGV